MQQDTNKDDHSSFEKGRQWNVSQSQCSWVFIASFARLTREKN